jgi:hypothetical protein
LTRFRWPYLLLCGLALWVLLVLWTLRAAAPERGAGPGPDDHYLPLPGAELFALTGGPDGRYTVKEAGAACESDTVVVDGELSCGGYRFAVRDDGRGHRLVLEGVAVAIPATVGSGRDADRVLSVPGMGAEHVELLPIDACAPDPTVERPAVCVRNGGAGGTLVVDRSARQSQTKPLPRTREAPDHGATALVDEKDLVWAGPVPFRVRAQDGEVLLTVPIEDWTTIAGDRRWMSLELPSWALSDGEATKAETHVFWSREALFSSSVAPWSWETHLAERRVEWEQEELLQKFVDHELLCLAGGEAGPALRWNLETGIGCDGRPIPPPPAALWREAEQAAYQPGTDRLLDVSEAALAVLPDDTPDPASLVFVFDWAWSYDGEERRRVPVRLLGVRPTSTVNGPPVEVAPIAGDDPCAIAKSGARAPIDVTTGSVSGRLEVTAGPIAAGTRLLLPASGTICVGGGKSTQVPGYEPADGPISTLGTLFVRDDGRAFWTAGSAAPLPDGVKGECRTLDPKALTDGERVRIGTLDLLYVAPSDHAAVSEVHDGQITRSYPFGRDLSPVVGYGPFAGGIEGAGTAELWETANEAWKASVCGSPVAPVPALETTIDGDLQRIVSAELAATLEAGKGDDVDASAVLLDANTGRILAVANAPAFDPADPDAVEALRRSLRLAGPQGRVREPLLDNRAFLRAKNAGSVYKLATSYTLGREGLLAADGKAPPAFGCTRFTWYSEAPPPVAAGVPPALLQPDWTPDGKRSQPCGKGAVVLDPGEGFHEAFRKSINLFFGIAPFALVDGSGVTWAAPKPVSALKNPLENPLDGPGLFAWTREGRADLGLVLSSELDVTRELGGTAFLDTLVRIGHRFHYPKAGGGVLYTQRADGVGEVAYPTVDAPWLPGLRPGSGFRYPSLVGPEAYALEGVPGWASRNATIAVRNDGKTDPVELTVATSSIREYSRLAYGMGGVEASALSLAVMGSPMARADGAAVAPWLIVSPGGAGGGAVPAVVGEGRAEIEKAMRAVVNEPGSTAYGWFPKDVASRIGGKTGTYEVARLTSDVGRRDPQTWASIERIARYGCGALDADPSAADWKRLDAALEGLTSRRAARHLKDRPYVQPVLDELIANPPARGFAASAASCVEWELNPGRAGVGASVAGTDAGLWLDAALGAFPRDLADEELVEGSSFVAVVFDGLADSPEPGKPPPGQGWVLAVVVDGHPTGAKNAAARILDRLQQHLQVVESRG